VEAPCKCAHVSQVVVHPQRIPHRLLLGLVWLKLAVSSEKGGWVPPGLQKRGRPSVAGELGKARFQSPVGGAVRCKPKNCRNIGVASCFNPP
jgi:hypothetical protein